MKKTVKMMIALLAVAAMLLSLAACGTKKGGSDSELLQGIFDKLTANTEYTEWKSYFNATTFEEKLNGDSIVITAKGDEGVNGEYTFTLDGDYLVCTTDTEDYSAYSFILDIKTAVAEYYGMNNMLMSGYLAGLMYTGEENTCFFTETGDGKTTYKLYVAKAWDMQGLDEMYITDAAVADYEPLGGDSTNYFFNSGTTLAVVYGDANNAEMLFGEYGGNTELTYKSILTVVNGLQPTGYEGFAASFPALKEGAGDGYTVSFGIPEAVSAAHEYAGEEGYSYVTVVFGGTEAPEDGQDETGESGEDAQRTLADFAGVYSADRCTITVEVDGETDAKISVIWGSSASEAAEYTMSGMFDPDTIRINYSDCEKKNVTYAGDGSVAEETVEFSDGVGRIQFYGDGTLAWQDEQEAEALSGMTFTQIN